MAKYKYLKANVEMNGFGIFGHNVPKEQSKTEKEKKDCDKNTDNKKDN